MPIKVTGAPQIRVQFHQTAGKRNAGKGRKVWAKFSKERFLLFSGKRGAAFPVKDCTHFVCTAVLHGTTNIRAKANFRLKRFEKL